MPGPYGVISSGFNPKIGPEILADLETRQKALWGATTVVDAQSPLGQHNGIVSDALNEVWQVAHAIYNALDIDTAQSTYLDALGKLQRVKRPTGLSDAAYRKLITNYGYGDIKTRGLEKDVRAITGVTWVNIIENDGNIDLANGVPGHSIAIAVDGGTDDDVANLIWKKTTGGIGLHGNSPVSITPDGRCRTMRFIRPIDVPINIQLNVTILLDDCQCAPNSADKMIADLITLSKTECNFVNGMTLSPSVLKKMVSSFPGVVVDSVLLSANDESVGNNALQFSAFHRPVATTAKTTILFSGTISTGQTAATSNTLSTAVGTNSFGQGSI